VVLDFLSSLDGIAKIAGSSTNLPSSVLNRKGAISLPWGTPAVAM